MKGPFNHLIECGQRKSEEGITREIQLDSGYIQIPHCDTGSCKDVGLAYEASHGGSHSCSCTVNAQRPVTSPRR